MITQSQFKIWLWFILLAFALIVSNSVGLPQNIKIGGLFDIWDPYEETAFRHAVERVNGGPNALKISAQLEKLDSGDSFHASKTVCSLLQDGIVGIFGPQSTAALSHVHSICEILGIPHIETKWDFRSSTGSFLLNLYPHPETMKKAYADLMSEWRWGKIIILYESHESLERLQGIFQLTGPGYIATDVVVQQLPTPQSRPGIGSMYSNPNNDENIYWPLMKRLKDTYPDYTYVIVDSDIEKIPMIMKAANASGMTKDNYKYFLTSLDIHTLKEEDVRYGDVNVTAFRMVNPNDEIVSEVINSWNLWKVAGRVAFESIPVNYQWYRKSEYANAPQTLVPQDMPDLRNGTLRLETALIYDAITLFAGAFQTLLAENQQQQQRGSYSNFEIKPVSCDTPIASLYGAGLVSTMKALKFKGLTGVIDIDADGFRRDITLDVVEMTKKGLEKIGEWSTKAVPPFNSTRSIEETKKMQTEDLKRAILTVGSVLTDPYFMKQNDTYVGFVVDLMDELKQNLGFSYNFKEVTEHGSRKSDGRWSGCIGEILNDTADLCIGDMSITYDRGNSIDFTTPFMNLGISILYTKPFKKPSFIFSFLQPFHSDVWIYMATAYLGVSLILFILARISPQEWTSSHICEELPSELELTLHLTNSLWFTIGSLMQQGSDIAPRAASTRMVAGIWWFFTLIMISSYTANLAAFLTSEGLEEGIKDISDLPKQSKVKYGTLESGSTFRFFQESTFPLYMEIFKNMEAMKPKPYAPSSGKGREMVLKYDGKYAFFMESVSIEYVTERYCKLTQLGGLLDQKGYGIGLKKGSKFRDVFTTQVLNLSENGVIEQLKTKWWKSPEHGGGKCQKETVSSGGAQALTMSHVGGVFVVLLGGCVLAIIMAFVEFFWKARKLALQGGKSVWAEIGKELKFALLCQGETKPIRKRESLNPTLNSEAESARYLVGSMGTGGGGAGNNMTRNSSLDQKE